MNSSKAKTWDFQWWFARTINNGLTIIPNVNLVSNIGFDSSAVHTTASSPNVNLEVYSMKFPMKEPDFVMENVAYEKALFVFFSGEDSEKEFIVGLMMCWSGKLKNE